GSAVLAVDDLARRTALARDPIPLDLRKLCPIWTGRGFQDRTDLARHLGAIDLLAGGCAVTLEQRQGHHVAVACKYGISLRHLQQRDGQAVAISHGRVLNRVPALPGPYPPSCHARQVGFRWTTER